MTSTPSSLTPKSAFRSRMEMGPRNVDVGEVLTGGGLLQDQPSLLELNIQRLCLQARTVQKLLLVHDHDVLPSRGLNALPLSQFETNASSSGSGGLGRTTLKLDELITVTSAAARCALALQTQGRAGVRSLWHRHRHFTGRRRDADPPSEHGLGERHRQFQRDVVALARETLVGHDLDLDQGIARTAFAGAGCALAAQTQ